MTYTSRDIATRTFSGIVWGAYGSIAGTPSVGDAIDWIQHEIWVVYGPWTGLAMTQSDLYRPHFDMLSSTNAGWHWDGDFGPGGGDSAWHVGGGTGGISYTQHYLGNTSPYQVLGLERRNFVTRFIQRWQLYLPCGVSEYGVGGEIYDVSFYAAVGVLFSTDGSNWVTGYSASNVFTDDGWEVYGGGEVGGESDAPTGGEWRYMAFANLQPQQCHVEAQEISIVFDPDLDPEVTFMPEETLYPLDIRIEDFAAAIPHVLYVTIPNGLILDETVTIDTLNKTVTMTYGDSVINVFNALRRKPIPRTRDWFPVPPGEMLVKLYETGLAGMTFTVEWRNRWYS
jgi:hypothetical protein